jgi:hypothetical protein
MLTGVYFPSRFVIASHLVPRSIPGINAAILGVGNSESAKNGLLLFKPLQRAFDHLRISFIYEKDRDCFSMKTFDKTWPNYKKPLVTIWTPDI